MGTRPMTGSETVKVSALLTRSTAPRWDPVRGDFSVIVRLLVMGNSAAENYASSTVGTVVNLPIDVRSDPLTDSLTRALTFPLRELYAVLGRAGIVEIGESADASPGAA